MSDSLKNLFESMFEVCLLVTMVGFLVDMLISFGLFLIMLKLDENIFKEKYEKYLNIRPYISSTIALSMVGITVSCICLKSYLLAILIWTLNCYFWIERAVKDYKKAMKK